MIARIVLLLALFGLVASCARAIPQIVTPHPVLPTFAPAQDVKVRAAAARAITGGELAREPWVQMEVASS